MEINVQGKQLCHFFIFTSLFRSPSRKKIISLEGMVLSSREANNRSQKLCCLKNVDKHSYMGFSTKDALLRLVLSVITKHGPAYCLGKPSKLNLKLPTLLSYTGIFANGKRIPLYIYGA